MERGAGYWHSEKGTVNPPTSSSGIWAETKEETDDDLIVDKDQHVAFHVEKEHWNRWFSSIYQEFQSFYEPKWSLYQHENILKTAD